MAATVIPTVVPTVAPTLAPTPTPTAPPITSPVAGIPGPAAAPLTVPGITGTVTDAATGAPIPGVCVTLGPPIKCAVTTDANGKYTIAVGISGLQWDLYFLLRAAGYKDVYVPPFVVTGPTTKNVQMSK